MKNVVSYLEGGFRLVGALALLASIIASSFCALEMWVSLGFVGLICGALSADLAIERLEKEVERLANDRK